MSETAVQLRVYDVPPEQAGALRWAIHDLGFEVAAGEPPDSASRWLMLGEPGYRRLRSSLCCVFTEHKFHQLVENAADGALWAAWEPPHSGQLGTLVIHVPGREIWVRACDGEGLPVANALELREIADDVAAVHRLMTGDGRLDVVFAAAEDDVWQREHTAAGRGGQAMWVRAPARGECGD